MSNIHFVPDALPLIATVRGAHDAAERMSKPKVVLSLWRGLMPVMPAEMTPSEICREVAFAAGFTVAELRGKGRKHKLCVARFEAMWRIYKTGRVSTTWIGRYFDDRDHTTVLHALRRHEHRMSSPE